MHMYTDKVLTPARQLYRAQRLDLKSFCTILASVTQYGGQSYQIEICSDIIAWAEKQESDEATAIYWIAHDCLTEVMK